ncbi:MAG TPA: transposase [Methanosarcina sp.]|nr:transposase [Methanosarcina sp.]
METIDPNGVFILDESSMKNSGSSSVRVSRQYCGNLGKVENCQVGVIH